MLSLLKRGGRGNGLLSEPGFVGFSDYPDILKNIVRKVLY